MTADTEFIPSAIAATASGSLEPAMNADGANELFSSLLRNVAVECVGAGAWMIGHIKANIRSGNELLSISCTTDDGNVRRRYSFAGTVKDYSMTVNVIVYGIERHRTAEILVSNMQRMFGRTDIKVHSEVGCEDPGCSDPMCQDADHKRVIEIR